MIRIFIITFLVSAKAFVFGQKADNKLKEINSIQQAQKFIDEHPQIDAKLFQLKKAKTLQNK